MRGRLEWEDGSPVAMAKVRTSSSLSGGDPTFVHQRSFTTTDAGDFEVEVYWNADLLSEGGRIAVRFELDEPLASAEAEYPWPGPYEPSDVGTVRLVLPPVVAQGIVVDEEGRPVSDAWVQCTRSVSTTFGHGGVLARAGGVTLNLGRVRTLVASGASFDASGTRTDSAGRWSIRSLEVFGGVDGWHVEASRPGFLSAGVAALPPDSCTTIVLRRARELRGQLVLPEGIEPHALEVVLLARGGEAESHVAAVEVEEDASFEIVVPEAPGWDLELRGPAVVGPVQLVFRGVDSGPVGRERWAPSPTSSVCRLEIVDENGAPFDAWRVGASETAGMHVQGSSSVLLLSGGRGRVHYLCPRGRWGWADIESPMDQIVSSPPIEVEILAELVSADLVDHRALSVRARATEAGAEDWDFHGSEVAVVGGRAVIEVPFAGEWWLSALVAPITSLAPDGGFRIRTSLRPVRLAPGASVTVEF